MYSLKRILNLVRTDVSRRCVEKGMAFLPEYFGVNLTKAIEECVEEDKELLDRLLDSEKKKEIIDRIVDKMVQKQ